MSTATVSSCANQVHLSSDNFTMDQAQQCPKAYQDFEDLTGGTDSDIISMIADELSRHTSGWTGMPLSNEALKKTNELLVVGPPPRSLC
jgi:hypothetical protein